MIVQFIISILTGRSVVLLRSLIINLVVKLWLFGHQDDVVKLADFGSCRSVFSKQPYTEYISTRWYRAPECLLTDGYYTYKMDMWSVGCVFFEIMRWGGNSLGVVHALCDLTVIQLIMAFIISYR